MAALGILYSLKVNTKLYYG